MSTWQDLISWGDGDHKLQETIIRIKSFHLFIFLSVVSRPTEALVDELHWNSSGINRNIYPMLEQTPSLMVDNGAVITGSSPGETTTTQC